MKRTLFLTLLAVGGLTMMGLFAFKMNESGKWRYPETAKVDTVDVYFGTKVPDPCRWLEDDRSAETKAWVTAQNEVTQNYLSQIPFRDKINKRLTQIWNYEKMGIPIKKGGRYFFAKNNGLQNQSVYYVQDDLGAEPKVILDPNALSEKGTVALSHFEVSKNGKYLCYGLASAGSDWNELFVKEVATGNELPDHIKWVKFSEVAWFGDGFFYSRFPQPSENDELKGENKNNKVYFHRLGTQQSDDSLVFEDNANPQWSYSPQITDDGRYLVLSVTESTSGNAVYVKDLAVDNSLFIKSVPGFGADYALVSTSNDKLVFLTNQNAPNSRLVTIDPTKPIGEQQNEFLPSHPSEVLTNASIVGGKILANYMRDAHSVVKVFGLDGHFLKELELPTVGTVTGLDGEADDKVVFYSFSSYTYPSVIYKYDIEKDKSDVFYQTKVNVGLDNYETHQLFFTSSDGTKVPMFVVHKKGLKLDGSHPLWLYGYGGFNISLNPNFAVSRLLWLENGGIYVVVNLRGGGEYGEDWHLAGTKMNKKNVFNDFEWAARHLIKNGYTSAGRIVAQGGSNGGLLIGATINQAPELFGVAFPQVGVLDMLRYHKFTIGRYWATDYGTSEESKEMFDYLLAYSPIHNIDGKKNYPAVLVTTGDHDDRVVPAHSFKYIATLQEKSNGSNPALVRIEIEAGHGAGKPTSKTIAELTDVFAFAFHNLGMTPVE